MAVQPKIRNARKSFNFKVIMSGVDQFSIQDVELPEKDIEAVEHGDTNYNVGTPGKVSWSDLKLKKLLNLAGPDNVLWDWMLSAQSTELGGGLPVGYERVITLLELSADGITTLNTHIITCWPKKIKRGKHSRVDAAENVMDEVDFHVNGYSRI